MIADVAGDDAAGSTYSITVESRDGDASTMIMITVSDDWPAC